MDLIKTNVPGISRDPYSKALHIVDKKGRAEFQEKQKIQSQINNLSKTVEELKTTVSQEISEIKELLMSISKGNQ